MNWQELGNFATVITLCGIAWGIASRVYKLIESVTSFFRRLASHIEHIDGNLEEALTIFKAAEGSKNVDG